MSQRYEYTFTDSGLFTLVDRSGEPLYRRALPLVERLLSHIVWIAVWLALILLSNYFWGHTLFDKICMSLVFVHLFFFGCRLTTLMVHGGLRPLLFPPLWVRLSRRFRKGEGLELLKCHKLETHPGLLANLTLAQVSRKELNKANQTIRYALAHNPDHPILLKMGETLGRLTDHSPDSARQPALDRVDHPPKEGEKDE